MLDGLAEIITGTTALLVAITGLLTLFYRKGKRAIDEATSRAERANRRNDPLWTFIDNLPIPAWQKDRDSRMLWINSQYSIQWNIAPHRYEGQFDSAIWPKDVAAQFVQHDLRVIREKAVLETTEEVPDTAGDLNAPRRVWRIWKFPIVETKDGEDDVVGVGGFAAPLSLSLEGYKHAEVSKDPSEGNDPTRNQLAKWSWKRLKDENFEGFGEVVASLLGVGLIRE